MNSITAIRIFAFCVLLGSSAYSQADSPDATTKAPAKVMLLGLFHFDNPGFDAVKYKPLDVMQPAEQAYLAVLAMRLAEFAPTKVLLEYPLKSDATINQRFTDFLAGKFDLPRNEIYQIGFRVAKLAAHSRVYGFDAEAPAFDEALWNYLPKEPAAEKRLMDLISSESSRLESVHRTSSLKDILVMSNSAREDQRNKGFYLLLNDVAAKSRHFYGADAAANWWHRNFRMYALVQTFAMPGERVLVIAGSGHTAILRDLLRADSDRLEVDVLPYL